MKHFSGKNKYMRAGIFLLGVFLLLVVFVPIVSPYSPTAQDLSLIHI